MNDNKVTKISRVVGMLFFVYGIILFITVVTVLFGTGLSKYADEMLKKLGEDSPYTKHFETIALVGSLLVLLLSIIYFWAGYGLYKTKRYTSKALLALEIVGLAAGAYNIFIRQYIGIADLVWGIIYIVASFKIAKKTNIYSN